MIKKILYLLFGFFSTSPVLGIKLGGGYITCYILFLPLIFLELLFSKHIRYETNGIALKYVLWAIIGLVSCGFGYLYFWEQPDWQKNALYYVPYVIVYLLMFLLMRIKKDASRSCSYLIKGLFLGFLINLVVAIIDSGVYYASGYSITNTLFADFIAAHRANSKNAIALATAEGIRSSGFNVDPSDIGMFAIILTIYALYKRRYYLIVIAFLGCLASISIVGLAGMIMAILVHIKLLKLSPKAIIGIGASIIAVVIMASNIPIIETMRFATTARIEQKEGTIDDKENRRAQYWFNFLPAVVHSPNALLIGNGYFTASYAYKRAGNQFANFPYDPEQTYFAYYFDIGLIGFLIMMMMYWQTYKKLKRRYNLAEMDEDLYPIAGLEGIAIACLGYHYTIYSVVMLMTMCAIVQVSKSDKNKKKVITNNIRNEIGTSHDVLL